MIAVSDWAPLRLATMKSGYAQMGGTQFLPGYCLLFAEPAVRDLTDLDAGGRAAFLRDMGLLGDAIMAVCQPARINYAILGNSHPFLHAHLFPRYDREPAERRARNVWSYPEAYWTDAAQQFDAVRHGEMKRRLAEVLENLIKQNY